MAVSLKQIKKLREETGAGVMEAKRALEDADGDYEEAVVVVRERGIKKAEKKTGRVTTQGVVEAYVHAGGKIGVLVEVLCETDFVARTDDFRNLAHELCLQVAAMDPKDVENLLSQPYIKDMDVMVSDLVKTLIAKTGENIVLKRFVRVELGQE